jgi:hypothetical protein
VRESYEKERERNRKETKKIERVQEKAKIIKIIKIIILYLYFVFYYYIQNRPNLKLNFLVASIPLNQENSIIRKYGLYCSEYGNKEIRK